MKLIIINNKLLIEMNENSFNLFEKEVNNLINLDVPSQFQNELEVFISKNNFYKEHSSCYELKTFYKIFWSYIDNKYKWKYILCLNGKETEEEQDLKEEEYIILDNICKNISIHRRNDQFKVDLN